MTSRSFPRALFGLMIAAILAASEASAAPPPGRASTAGEVEAQARALAQKGKAHFDDGEYLEAHEALQKSLELWKKRGVMALAASCLRQLGRYDEALSLYEEVLREFPDAPFRKKVEGQIAELQALVGTLAVAGDAPNGATLLVDDRRIGVLPLAEPLRVSVGTHRIRVEKEGFEPLTAKIDVKGGQESLAQLVATSREGRLVVRERHNWTLYVEIDGKDVGVTPWEGLVEAGEHRVRLHGLVDLDALEEDPAPEAAAGGPVEVAKKGTKMASAVQMATVPLYGTMPLMLRAVELDAPLRIESTPKGATVKIDSNEVGKTPWDGRLSLGEHVIEVSASGFIAAKQTMRLERRKQRELSVVLEREPDRAAELRAARNRKIGVGVAYGVGVVGLGMFAVAGGLAFDKVNDLEARCLNQRCPSTEAQNLEGAATLETVSTVGLVVGGLGAATGTVVLLLTRPAGGERRAGPSVSAGVGLGGFEMQGRF